MRVVLYLLTAWFLVSIPVALLFGRLCSLREAMAPETADVIREAGHAAVPPAAASTAFLQAS